MTDISALSIAESDTKLEDIKTKRAGRNRDDSFDQYVTTNGKTLSVTCGDEEWSTLRSKLNAAAKFHGRKLSTKSDGDKRYWTTKKS